MKDTLEIKTPGGMEVQRGGEPVTAFESEKVRALLAYLAVESKNPHHRERLAGPIGRARCDLVSKQVCTL